MTTFYLWCQAFYRDANDSNSTCSDMLDYLYKVVQALALRLSIAMDSVPIYGIAAGGVVTVCLLYCTSSYISHWIQDRTLFYVFKYLVYPIIIRRTRLSSPISRWHAILMTLYWLGTAVCNVARVDTVVQAGNRAGALAVLHLVPLLCTNRAAMAADLLGISLQTFMRLHTSFGLMALLQSLIHVVIFLTQNTFNVRESLHFYGLLVGYPHDFHPFRLCSIRVRLR